MFQATNKPYIDKSLQLFSILNWTEPQASHESSEVLSHYKRMQTR